MALRTKGQLLTSAEAEVMNVVWDHHPAGIPEIVERLPRQLAYSTVMTTVRILCDKGFLRQCGKRGRAFLYECCVERREVRGSMLHDLAERLFGGSVKSMVLNLIQDDTINREDLDELKQLIAHRELVR